MERAIQMIAVAAIVVIALAVILSLTLTHHIGGFFRTIEREAAEESKRRDEERARERQEKDA